MTGSSPGFHRVAEGGSSSSSGQPCPATNGEEDSGDDISEHQNLDSTLLDDDPLGDLSQAQLVHSEPLRFIDPYL